MNGLRSFETRKSIMESFLDRDTVYRFPWRNLHESWFIIIWIPDNHVHNVFPYIFRQKWAWFHYRAPKVIFQTDLCLMGYLKTEIHLINWCKSFKFNTKDAPNEIITKADTKRTNDPWIWKHIKGRKTERPFPAWMNNYCIR